jgi:P-type Cu+ transporter
MVVCAMLPRHRDGKDYDYRRDSRYGILIKGGESLEHIQAVRSVLLDKTGTITKGRPELTDVISVSTLSEHELLRLAALAEQCSVHPLAVAIVEGAKVRGLSLDTVPQCLTAIAGRGLEAVVDGHTNRPLFEEFSYGNPRRERPYASPIPYVRLVPLGQALERRKARSLHTGENTHVLIGTRRLFREHSIACAAAEKSLEELEQQGKTTMLVALDGTLAGIIAVADTVRVGSAQAI